MVRFKVRVWVIDRDTIRGRPMLVSYSSFGLGFQLGSS